MRRLAPLLLAAALLAGCGDSSGPKLVETTAAKLGAIHSGKIRLALLVTPQGAGGQQVGFEVDGPVALPTGGRLPEARLRYTQVIGPRRASLTLISKGAQGFLRVGGKTYELEPGQVEQLRSVAGALAAAGGLSTLDLKSWIADPHGTRCGDLAPGADVDCAAGDLNVANASVDLLTLARAVGREVPQLEGAGGAQLRDSVRSATVRLATGHQDRLLRSLVVDVRFRRTVAEPLRDLLGGLAGSTLHFAFDVSNPNRPVNVHAPSTALPYEDLGGGGR